MSIVLDLDFDKLNDLVKNGSRSELNLFCEQNSLKIVDNKIYYNGDTNEKAKFWFKRQLVKKTRLNSAYGAVSNSHCRFFDKRIGQSTTLTGRSIVKHMISEVNKVFTGKYDHHGDTYRYSDTDSVSGKSVIHTSIGDMTVQELFEKGKQFQKKRDKEYSYNDEIKVYHYSNGGLTFSNYLYVYRHRVSREQYLVATRNGKQVKLTGNHSLMVIDGNNLYEKRPDMITTNDMLLTIVGDNVEKSKVKTSRKVKDFQDEYVYDIGIGGDNPYFFANDIMVHNSVYFSAYDLLKDDIERGDITWNKETVTDLYDNVCTQVNGSFSKFMKQAFHCPESFSKPIAAGREIVGTSGLFITKKRYAIMVFDNEGKREDVNGKPGKIKAMGLDLRRSDTPTFVQDFLKEILEMVLLRHEESVILERIVQYREEFRNMPSWKMGTPKSVNKLTWYRDQLSEGKKVALPGHVRASLNWNSLRSANSDNYSMEIVDGMKIIVCKLRNNPMGYTSIAYPTDEPRLPEWFKELSFDEPHMEMTILDKKLENLIGQLGYDIEHTNVSNTFNNLFEF